LWTIAREQAEHFCPWNPNAEATTCWTASSKSASSSTTMKSLPPHLQDRSLDEELALGGEARLLLDSQAHRLRARERDEPRQGVLDDVVAHVRARAGKVLDDAVGEAGLLEDLEEPPGHQGRVRRRLEEDGVSRDGGGRRHAEADGGREVPRRNDGADAEGNVEGLREL